MLHSRIIIISIVVLVTSATCGALIGLNMSPYSSALLNTLYYVFHGASIVLVGMYYGVKSEHSFVMRHNVRDILSLWISCVVSSMSIVWIFIVFKLLHNYPTVSIILMLIIMYKIFDSTVDIAIKIHYPSDANDKFINDDDLDD